MRRSREKRNREKRRREQLIIGEKLVIGSVIASALIYIFSSYPRFYPFPDLTSLAVGFMLRTVGFHQASSGRYLIVAFDQTAHPLAISGECAGVIVVLVFILVIFLSPYFTLAQKFASFIFLPIILFGNVLRIFIAILIGAFSSMNAMLFFHSSIGNVFMFCWAMVCYLLWLGAIKKGARQVAAAP